MTRWALLVEYDGTGFVGWQRQAAGLSVQAVLEAAAARIAGGPVASVVAGRTDAGVHAAGQVAHIDLARAIAPRALAAALCFHMKPHRVAVLRAAVVPEGWSARFSAIGRRYRYTILDRPSRPALDEARLWHAKRPLDVEAMRAAASCWLGRHDFTSFRAAACQARSPWRTLDRLDVRREGERVVIEAAARSFLHHQVRIMTGTLALIGAGKVPVSEAASVLAARDRARAGPTAPPQGLVLEEVRYEADPFAAAGGVDSAGTPPA